jgi:competence protein ComEA
VALCAQQESQAHFNPFFEEFSCSKNYWLFLPPCSWSQRLPRSTSTKPLKPSIKGIGPVTTKLIISERKKGEFKSWDDFVARVKGVGDKSAAKFSAEGLTVSGAKYEGPSAAPAKKADKPLMEKAKDAAISTKDAVKGAAISTKDAVKETAKDVKKAVTPKADGAKPAASAAKK